MSRYDFITLTHVGERGRGKKTPGRRFMVSQIVSWIAPLNGAQGSVIITVDTDENGWYVAETPDEIDELIRRLDE